MKITKRKLKKDIRLTDKAIAHWENMRADIDCGEEPNPEGCALCNEYNSLGCRGCPIHAVTGLTSCFNTPYAEAATAFVEALSDSESLPTWHIESGAMIGFLIGVRGGLARDLERRQRM